MTNDQTKTESACHIATEPDYTKVKIVELPPTNTISDFNAAKILANQVADKELEEHMLLAFRDGDRDFNSPEHGDECHSNSPVPAYIDYALYHGATLKVDIEGGRFEFFYVGF